MDSLYSVFAKDIEVVISADEGLPMFNGWNTVDAALMDCNELYKQLSFVDRMAISAGVMNMVCPLPREIHVNATVKSRESGARVPGKRYIYTYDWDRTNDDWACMVFDTDSGNVIFDEWFKVLNQHSVMETKEDVEGLMHFLIAHGELIPGDKISFELKSKGPNDGTLEA